MKWSLFCSLLLAPSFCTLVNASGNLTVQRESISYGIIFSILGLVLALLTLALLIKRQKHKQPYSEFISERSHLSKQFEKLITQIKQVEYTHSKGFTDNKEYRDAKERVVKKIKKLKGLV